MSFAGTYLERVSLDPQIDYQVPSPNLSFVVAIPACNEPDLIKTLHSLRNCQQPDGDVEIIIGLNSSESAGEDVIHQNLLTEKEISEFAQVHSDHRFRVLHTNRSGIREKDAGAGVARKLAMDHALSRFSKLNNPDGIIFSLDADTLVEPNYFRAVEEHFRDYPGCRACSLYFEHPLKGQDFTESVYRGIMHYELHLRYYIQGLRHAGHPHAYHTVGSAFCVKAGVYASQGGMNKRTAGEDFYFLQKIIPLGNYHDLNSTCIIPSPRPSPRVAFGTGPVISKFISGEIKSIDSYNPLAFNDLSEFISRVPSFYSGSKDEIRQIFDSLPETIRADLGKEFHSRVEEIKRNSAREETFRKRFFRWFNMFRTLKYINSAHRDFYPRIPVHIAVYDFMKKTSSDRVSTKEVRELLVQLRRIQRESNWPD
jgi:hypothetical protein